MSDRSRTGATYVGGNRVLLKTASGLKLYVDSRDVSISPHLILDGVWEEWTERVLLQLVRSSMTVVEVGANIGYFTATLARATGAGGRVFAFECDPELAQTARDNIEINGLQQIARIVEQAVGERNGTVTFFRADRHRGGGSIVKGLEQNPMMATDQRTAIEVPMTTLDAFLEREKIQPDLIKLDAEGAEPAILRASPVVMEARRPLTIVMEFFPRFVREAGDDPGALLGWVRERGFELAAINEKRRRAEPASIEDLLARESAELVLTRRAK
jgi:FkbM family methyltransferase